MTLLCKDSAREDSLALRQLSYCFGNLRQLGVGGAALQPEAVIDCGGAAEHCTRGDGWGGGGFGFGCRAPAEFFLGAVPLSCRPEFALFASRCGRCARIS